MLLRVVLCTVAFSFSSETPLTHVKATTAKALVHDKLNVGLTSIASDVKLVRQWSLEVIVLLGSSKAFSVDVVEFCAESRLQDYGRAGGELVQVRHYQAVLVVENLGSIVVIVILFVECAAYHTAPSAVEPQIWRLQI